MSREMKPNDNHSEQTLIKSITQLMEIVEGVRNVRWQYNGNRLVDTTEWCDFYSAWCSVKRNLSKHDAI